MAVDIHTRGRSENAFNEVAPFASSSGPLRQPPYHVFINHRGPDTKSTLASSIYYALESRGVEAFLDQKELQSGELIPQAIEAAMRSAQVHIAIFSKDYAASPWCLAELRFMHEKTRSPIIPVFYNVDPSHLKWVTKGPYAEAFSKHERSGRYSAETIEKWKNAVERVASNSGVIFKTNKDGECGLLLVQIVDRVMCLIMEMNVPFEEAKHPVGLDKAVEEFEAFLKAQVRQGVKIVGIAGMGGCGKTTIARKYCRLRYTNFNSYSFLSDVRKADLRDLQKKLLVDLFHCRHLPPYRDGSELKGMLYGRFRNSPRRLLIILDDVDKLYQLEALLPAEGKCLGWNSLVIVTTRDPNALKQWGIEFYGVKTLDKSHAKELFSWHAFSQNSPPPEFEDLVEKFTDYCNGSPLFVKVIAGMLSRKPEQDWKSKLEKLSRLNTKEIKELKPVIYDELEEEEKFLFLDVACFFVGEKINLAIAVWEADGREGREIVEDLVNKCLVEVDSQNRIRMNDILRDLGRQIAIEILPPRLWSQKHLLRIIGCRESISVIRGINAVTTRILSHSGRHELLECCDSYRLPFEELRILGSQMLQLLLVHGQYFTQDFSKLSVGLLWLRCFDFQDEILPSCLSLTNLRILELYGASSLQDLWENHVQPPKQLREMIITAREGTVFDRFPSNIAVLEHLTKIALISYDGTEFRFEKLPEEFCNLQSLEHLELRHCELLSELPGCFGELVKLRYLDLCGCVTLRNLPDSFTQLVNLEHLDLSGCKKLVPAPDILVNIKRLKNLYFSGCSKLQDLPLQIAEQKSLRELHLKNTVLMKVPNEIDQLRKLEVLVIGSPILTGFPTSLLNLSSLTLLKIVRCVELESLPESEDCFKLLEYLVIKACENMRSLPEWLRRLTNLQSLKIIDCPITKLDFGSGSPSSLNKLKMIQIKGTDVMSISFSQGCCSNLEILQVQQNHSLRELVNVPKSVRMVDAPNSVKKVYRYERRLKKQSLRKRNSLNSAGF